MTTTTHTPATLLALYQQDPRKLDALAAEVVMGANRNSLILCYSFDRSYAAILEAKLERPDVRNNYLLHLANILGADNATPFNMITATAVQRTIAAILAAQEVK